MFERKLEIYVRISNWRAENEQLRILCDITDNWTPVEREVFLRDWNDDEGLVQVGHGQKRTYDEMEDDLQDDPQDDQSENERPFFVESGVQVNIKKFRTTGINYRVRFMNV